jgi:hypothetical protein
MVLCNIFRKTVAHLSTAIDANGLTVAQPHWRGTHDTILGYILWIYDVEVLSLIVAGGYSGTLMKAAFANRTDDKTKHFFDKMKKGNIMFHSVSTLIYAWRIIYELINDI